jgi:hypothetical protein
MTSRDRILGFFTVHGMVTYKQIVAGLLHRESLDAIRSELRRLVADGVIKKFRITVVAYKGMNPPVIESRSTYYRLALDSERVQ